MSRNAMPSGFKRETWRPQPTSSWAPSQDRKHKPSGPSYPSASGSSSRSSPPPPPTGPRAESSHRSGDGYGGYRSHRAQGSDRDRDDEDRGGWRGGQRMRDDGWKSREERAGARDEDDRRHSTRPARDRSEERRDRGDRGWNRSRDEASGVDDGHHPRGSYRSRLKEEDRPWSARKADESRREDDRRASRFDRPLDRPPRSRTKDHLDYEADDKPARARRPSPNYGSRSRRRSTTDSPYSPPPRRLRSPSPISRPSSPPFSDRKRAPPSPRGGDHKRQRDDSPARSVASSRRRRSPSRSLSRSPDKYRRRLSPSPPRSPRRSPSPRYNDRPAPSRRWGREDSRERERDKRDRRPASPPTRRAASPPTGPRRRSPTPPRGPRGRLGDQSDMFKSQVGPQRTDNIPTGPRGPPFGGWGRSAPTGPAGEYLPPPGQLPPFPPNGHPPFPPTQPPVVPNAPTGPAAPPSAPTGPVKIAFSEPPTGPARSGWRTEPPSRPAAVRQFFDDSAVPSPASSTSKPPSPRRAERASPEPERPPLKAPEVYLDLIEQNEREYARHLSTFAPYLQAAFDKWYAQKAEPDLPEFLDHFFGQRASAREITQVESLLGVKNRFMRDQDELKALHRQAIDLRESRNGGHASNGAGRGRWSPPTGPRGRRSPTPLSRTTSPQPPSLASRPETDPSTPSTAPPTHVSEQASVPPPRPTEIAQSTKSPVSSKKVAKPLKPVVDGELYERMAHVGEGTYGKVYKARNLETGAFVALKRIRMEGEKDGFPVTAMREIKLLQNLRHRNILRLIEMMVSKGSVYMVLEYMDHDLTGVLAQSKLKFSAANLKSLNFQMLDGLAYLHDQGILHRDMKGSNILLNAAGELKLADFGLARMYSKRARDDYTNRVITLWYRGPELLLGETVYGPEVDLWSAGCIMLEMFTGKPVFQGNDEIHQLEVIFSIMGTPREDEWPGVKDLPWYELLKPKTELASVFRETFQKWLSPAALDLAQGLLCFDSHKRLSAEQAMKTAYFTSEEPPMEMPTQLANCGEHHEMSAKLERHRRRHQEGR